MCLRETGTVHAAAVCFDLHVPESRSLKTKRAAIRPMQIGANVVPGTHHIIDAGFLNFGFLTGESDAPAALIVSVAALENLIPCVGRLVVVTDR